MMPRWMWCGLLVASSPALAYQGSWSSHSFGGMMTQGKQVLKSRPVAPASALPPHSLARSLAWKITLDGPPPMGLRIQICGGNRCVRLPGLQGEIALPPGFPAGGPLWFEYISSVGGAISPPVTLLNNQVTVQYSVRPSR